MKTTMFPASPDLLRQQFEEFKRVASGQKPTRPLPQFINCNFGKDVTFKVVIDGIPMFQPRWAEEDTDHGPCHRGVYMNR